MQPFVLVSLTFLFSSLLANILSGFVDPLESCTGNSFCTTGGEDEGDLPAEGLLLSEEKYFLPTGEAAPAEAAESAVSRSRVEGDAEHHCSREALAAMLSPQAEFFSSSCYAQQVFAYSFSYPHRIPKVGGT
nr:hypothetical protein Iba_chr10dCG7470 [Ipomoea batatas]